MEHPFRSYNVSDIKTDIPTFSQNKTDSADTPTNKRTMSLNFSIIIIWIICVEYLLKLNRRSKKLNKSDFHVTTQLSLTEPIINILLFTFLLVLIFWIRANNETVWLTKQNKSLQRHHLLPYWLQSLFLAGRLEKWILGLRKKGLIASINHETY